jgi:Cys-tRNA(Pro) deacylase
MDATEDRGAMNGSPPSSPAVVAIRSAGIPFEVVETRPAHSAEESARLQGVPLAALLRTLVVRRGPQDYLFVLVPGGRRFDWPKLRSHLGVKRMTMPDADEARAVTGYERGAITPFGAATALPVIVDAAAMTQTRVAIGGGARGVNLHLSPQDLVAALGAEVVEVATDE